MQATQQPYFLNGIRVEPDALRIEHRQNTRRLEPKVMRLLTVLSEQPGALWRRDQLINRIWDDGRASDEALTRLVYQLRGALSAVGGMAAAVRTVPRLGYRLDAEVWPDDADARPKLQSRAPWPPFSVAVLPVEDLSHRQNGPALTQGLTRDLASLLARVPRFRVAPPSSVIAASVDSKSTAELAEALQCRFLVSTSLASAHDKLVVRAELIDAQENILVWSQRHESSFDQFFQLEEEVISSLSTAIATTVNAAQPLRVRRTGRFNLSAYERIQAAEALRANYGRESAKAIAEKLEQALEIEPRDPITQAALAVQLSQNVVSQWVDDPAATIMRADQLIATAIQSAPNDPEIRASAGIVATMFHRPDTAIEHLEVATARNPNDPHARAVLGWQHCLRHADPAGIELIKESEAQAPHHPRFGLWATYRATGHLFLLDHQEARAATEEAIERTPLYYQPQLTCAWAHVGLGDQQTARNHVQTAVSMESPAILEEFVGEMHRWIQNSPHRAELAAILERLAALNLVGRGNS